jgi:exonuclease III
MANSILTIATANVVTVQRHKTEVTNLLTRLELDILCLNETRLGPNKNFAIPGYEVVRKDRNTRGGGVAILTLLCLFPISACRYNFNTWKLA